MTFFIYLGNYIYCGLYNNKTIIKSLLNNECYQKNLFRDKKKYIV